MEKSKYEIFPIVENEIIPDDSLELIKGGNYTTNCIKAFECAKEYKNGQCKEGFSCYTYCWQCLNLQVCADESCIKVS